MAVLDIVHFGDPILKKKCNPVKRFDGIDRLLGDMFDTMYEEDGLGLAANQVGLDLHLFILDLSDIDGVENPLVIINGEITASEGESSYNEGCLSFPGIRLDINRPEVITLRYQNPNGNWETETFSDLTARVIQHEMDHVNGIMMIDRVSTLDKIKIRSELKNLEIQSNEKQKTRPTLDGYNF
ncbi:MAG: peptide deformylase [Candidatus Marinimicrobia bacterium]|jgi:peptide deformylase|nr:peptide deformylase [Candidatus Neomarinimicrobiota bacterium]MBT3496877.1 peptide deformylase [Candidatus Neomarinimicrobiota bacterium]MBT3692289.1 peptide deformylase [Candidatus Neomarinimicrobiota bacterium]MBT3732133.1 peptide deformylase [Candidatus Neomarinimicrobiota bacterium]MBT4144150.1 peptide deformylase [Candidatus Neomarinimicrobiota bacterium]